jgi:excisionase family DNA binding protein
MSEDETVWLTPEEAAERLRVSRRTLQALRSSGEGPRYSKRGQIVRYRADDVDEWMAGEDDAQG